MKDRRQEKILELIAHYDIDTQEELIFRLKECGVKVTQATVSRDIRELKLIKLSKGKGRSRYVVPTRKEQTIPKINSALTESIVSVDYAGNLLMVKTLPGLAGAVGACIDSLKADDILGCVAGDDAIMVVVRTPEKAALLCEKLRYMMRGM